MDDLEFQNLMDKVSFFKFRGIIISLSLEEIVKSIEVLETYNALLDTIYFTLYHDQNFFLLNYLQFYQQYLYKMNIFFYSFLMVLILI